MSTFVQIGKKFTPADGVSPVTVVSPGPTEGYLVSLFRVRFLMQTVKSDGLERVMTVKVVSPGRDTISVVEVPLFIADNLTTIDLIPFLSNTGNFGLSNPDSITVEVDEAVDASDELTLQGFSIAGGEA